jgi:predicted  nucleic acid-binding Zn-ribbon protein
MVCRQFALLMELQQLDDRLHALAREQQKLPQQTHLPEHAHRAAQQTLLHLQSAIEQSERQQRTLERELEHTQDAMGKIQAKLREVKTNKEYSAVLAEVATSKDRITALEDRLLQAMEDLDRQRLERQTQQQQVRAAEQELQQCQQAIQDALQALEQDIRVEREARQQTVTRLDPKLAEAYEKLLVEHNGHAVVYLQDGVCGGCHLKVQPQLVSNIRLQEALYTCPHCRLMLLWPAS